MTVNGNADYASAIRITPAFFETLRVKPQIGRLLSEEEERPGGPLAAVITDAFWRCQLGASGGARGATVKFGERIYQIVGVLPPGFRFPSRADIYYASARAMSPGGGPCESNR